MCSEIFLQMTKVMSNVLPLMTIVITFVKECNALHFIDF